MNNFELVKGGINLIAILNRHKWFKDRDIEEMEKVGCLKTVFIDGKLMKDYSLVEIRERIDSTL